MMQKIAKSLAITVAVIVMLFSGLRMLGAIHDLWRNERRRAYNTARNEERRRQDDERNMYLMGKLPEYFAGSYYIPNRLTIFLTEGGPLAAGELGLFSDARIREYVEYYDYRGRRRQRRVEFTYAQLLETHAAVIAAMEARPRCVYVDNITGPRISVTANRVVMETSNLIRMDYQEVVAGFRQYVYDSEMIDFQRRFYLPLLGVRSRRQNLTTIAWSGAVFLAAGLYVVAAFKRRHLHS